MEVTVRSWGNSLGIRIPKKILTEMKLKDSDVLEIETENATITLRKKFTHKTFEERLAEYDGKIEPYDFDWGEPKGKELV